MAELFQKDVRTINEHIKNIYTEGELEPEASIRKFRIVQIQAVPRAMVVVPQTDMRNKFLTYGKKGA